MEIIELEKRIAHLENLLGQIERSERYEDDFDKLYKLLKDEYQLEGGKDAPYIMGNYRHNLEQTMWKQADTYIHYRRKRPKKGALSEYSDFIRNFKQDVTEQLQRCEYILRTSSGQQEI